MAMACFLVLLLLCVVPAHGGRAGAGAGAVTKAQAPAANATTDEFLAPQNQARAAVGVAPLRWSADLATAAATTVSQQQRQNGCAFADMGTAAATTVSQQQRQSGCAFADMGASPYGANQGWASYRARPAEVVASWVAQGRYYSHANNTCAAGQQCGTYTQVVWRRTGEVGCAQASCATGATLTLCLYNPHGNVQGQSPY